MTLKKSDLTYAVALRASVDQDLARTVVSAVFDTIVRSLACGEAVSIQGFGKFDILEHEKRNDPVPGAREVGMAAPRRAVQFVSGSGLRNAVGSPQ